MEASVLKRKRTTISKGKIKKTIKNVTCRPDPVHWPLVSDKEGKELEFILKKYKVDIPDFKKPNWNDIKSIPKSERPKRPSIKKVDGLVFGLSQCNDLIEKNQLSALILEAEINPKAIVIPLLEVCSSKQIPVLCFTGLRKISVDNFGIKTSCLGVQKDFLSELTNKIMQISKHHQPKSLIETTQQNDDLEKEINQSMCDDQMEGNKENDKIESSVTESTSICPYLYRTNKERIFVPESTKKLETNGKQFTGQDFIEFANNFDKENNKKKERKAYKKMIVKRISNNPNRVKKK